MCRAMIIHKKADIKLNMGKKKKKVVTRKPVVSGVVQKIVDVTISLVQEIYRPNIKSCRLLRVSTTSLTMTTCTGSKMRAL